MTEPMLSPEQLATKLGVTPNAIRKWIHEGKIRATRLGTIWRIAPNDAAQFVNDGYRRTEPMYIPNWVDARAPEPCPSCGSAAVMQVAVGTYRRPGYDHDSTSTIRQCQARETADPRSRWCRTEVPEPKRVRTVKEAA